MFPERSPDSPAWRPAPLHSNKIAGRLCTRSGVPRETTQTRLPPFGSQMLKDRDTHSRVFFTMSLQINLGKPGHARNTRRRKLRHSNNSSTAPALRFEPSRLGACKRGITSAKRCPPHISTKGMDTAPSNPCECRRPERFPADSGLRLCCWWRLKRSRSHVSASKAFTWHRARELNAAKSFEPECPPRTLVFGHGA